MSPIQIGRFNLLTIVKQIDFGVYLDGGDEDKGGWGNILLPKRYVPENINSVDSLSVFVYFDSEDRIIATTETPKVQVGEFAYLSAVDVNATGAFLDWGLPKDLLVPYNQQAKKMRPDTYYLVYVYQDKESERITASSKVSAFLHQTPAAYQPGEPVDLLIMAKTDLGYKAIINNKHTGILYNNEIYTTLCIGQTITGHIKKIRHDGKIDLRLATPDKNDSAPLESVILYKLSSKGHLRLGDKTDPAVIYQIFGVSKKHFKRALSRLYKKRLIHIHDDSISLVKPCNTR